MLAELGEDLVDGIGNADAALDRHRAATERANFRAQRFGLVGAVVVVGRDVAAAARKLERDGAADAARGAGDESDLSGQCTGHVGVPAAIRGHGARDGRGGGGQNRYFNPAAGLRYNRAFDAAGLAASLPLAHSPMLDRRLPERAAGQTHAAALPGLKAAWRRGEIVLKWAAVALGCFDPGVGRGRQRAPRRAVFFWLAGGAYRDKLASIRDNPVAWLALALWALFVAGSLYSIGTRQDMLDALGKAMRLLLDPGAHLSAARPGVARARPRRVPRFDARDPRAVVAPVARSRFRQRLDQGQRRSTRPCSRRTTRTTCSWRSPRSCSRRRRSRRRAARARIALWLAVRSRERQRAPDGAGPHRHARAARAVRLFPRAHAQGQGTRVAGVVLAALAGDRPRVAGKHAAPAHHARRRGVRAVARRHPAGADVVGGPAARIPGEHAGHHRAQPCDRRRHRRLRQGLRGPRARHRRARRRRIRTTRSCCSSCNSASPDSRSSRACS